jgi:hypothetical protein
MAYTNIDDPSAYFQTALWTGDGLDNKQITNDGNSDLQPDWVWLKDRTQAESHAAFDSTRGATVRLQPNSNSLESTETATLKSFTTDGFTVGTSGSVNNGSNPDQYVAWQWKANDGTTSTDTSGDITSTVQANTDAGFSIVTYTGNTSNNQTVGHGLGVKPSVILIRNRTRIEDWRLNHQSINNGTGMIRLNSTDAYNTTGTTLMNVAPTSSVFNVSTDWSVNGNYSFVAYCFAEKQGYSKFGSYVGNSSTNGIFVYTGFKPAFILLKETSNSGNGWFLLDSARDPSNTSNTAYLRADESGTEGTSKILDLLSNGFKLRNNDNAVNGTGRTYIYMAFAENPFVTSTGVPTTAR